MKKILLFSLVAMMLTACGGQKSPQDGGHGIGTDSATVAQIDAEDNDSVLQRDGKEAIETERKLNIEHRKKYRFEYHFVKEDDNRYGSIIVKGHEAGGNSRGFECKHELWNQVSEDTASDDDWINATEDINFDGIPDLQIFLLCYTGGQVAAKYAAYVWTTRGQFEEVEQWTDLCNPEIHPENQTVTEKYRSSFNEFTYNTYKWNSDTLELINTRKEKIYDE